jgi:hypothetical protein
MDTIEVVFDENSPFWNASKEYNRVFLQCQENYFNHLLEARGHVFLNEIFDALGLKRTSYGQVAGWLSEKGKIDFWTPKNDPDAKVTVRLQPQGVIYRELDD